MLIQRKALPSGELKTWDVDLAAIRQKIPWANRDPGLLEEELHEITEHFPTFLVTVGEWRPEGEAWGGSGRLCSCAACGGLLVFDQGLLCADCRRPADAINRPLLGVAGRIPALLEGRPFHVTAKERLATLRRTNPPSLRTSPATS